RNGIRCLLNKKKRIIADRQAARKRRLEESRKTARDQAGPLRPDTSMKTLAQKRTRSDATTPTPSKKPPPSKKPKTFREAVGAIKMAIVRRGYPNDKVSEKEATEIEERG